MVKIEQNFYLNGTDEFSSRQKDVFAELDRMSTSRPENRYVQGENEFRERRAVVASGRRVTRQFAGQESLFKAPPEPLKRKSAGRNLNFVPDFVKHPTKWKKYDLGDDVMSDKSNQQAAMSFLKELRERKSEDVASTSGSSNAVVRPQVKFNRHVKPDGSSKSADEVAAVDKPTFVDGKLTMPEYVVGAEKKRRDKKTPKKMGAVAAGTAVKLGHLEELDDEEDH